jgi:hypothetical protein
VDVGGAWLFLGGATRRSGTFDATSTADAVIWGATPGDKLGMGVAGGDLDSDGHADLVLGAWGVDTSTGTADAGAVYVLHGPLSGTLTTASADATLSGDGASSALGECVRVADLDGDGQLDVLAPADGTDELAVFFGGGM